MKKKWIIIIASILVAIVITLIVLFNFLRGKGVEFSNSAPQNELPKIEVPQVEKNNGYISIPIYYGTNRKRNQKFADKIVNNEDNGKLKGDLFTGKLDQEIHYGYYRVSIPDIHKKGKLEQAGVIETIMGEDFNPKKYINLLNYNELSEVDFHQLLSKSLNNNHDQAFIFIHGYNNSFKSAALRTAQLFYDLDYDGVPIMYSWPSVSRTQGYFTDGKQIKQSINLFKKFLVDIADKNQNKKLNLIAHSMGNRLLVQAISELKNERPDISFANIIMAAPDVPREDFTKRHADNMLKIAKQVNLYCSKKDKALNLSKILNLESRLGTADAKIFKKKPIYTIDISNASDCEDILSHTCFAQTNHTLKDISSVLKDRKTNRTEKKGVYFLQ